MYIVPKSANESRVRYAPELAWGTSIKEPMHLSLGVQWWIKKDKVIRWFSVVEVTVFSGLTLFMGGIRPTNTCVTYPQGFSSRTSGGRQGSTVADKPTRCTASRQIFYKRIRWTLSAITCERTKLPVLCIESCPFPATTPAFNLPHLCGLVV